MKPLHIAFSPLGSSQSSMAEDMAGRISGGSAGKSSALRLWEHCCQSEPPLDQWADSLEGMLYVSEAALPPTLRHVELQHGLGHKSFKLLVSGQV